MKKILNTSIFIAFAIMTTAFINIDCKKINLIGTQWRKVEEMRVLDARTSIHEQISHFTTKKDVVITDKYTHFLDDYKLPPMNSDGTKNRVKATTSQSSKNATYKVSGKTITITTKDKFKSKDIYIYCDDYLRLIWDDNPDHFYKRYTP